MRKCAKFDFFIILVVSFFVLINCDLAKKKTFFIYKNYKGLNLDQSGNMYIYDDHIEIRKIFKNGKSRTFLTSDQINENYYDLILTKPIDFLYVLDNDGIKKISMNGAIERLPFTNKHLEQIDVRNGGYGFYYGMAIDKNDNIYFTNKNNNYILKRTTDGMISWYAGSGAKGYLDGTFEEARFNEPCGATIDTLGNLYVADTGNNLIRKISNEGVVSLFAGTGVAGRFDGPKSEALFNSPFSLVINDSNNLYVNEIGSVRKISYEGKVNTVITLNELVEMASYEKSSNYGLVKSINDSIYINVDDNDNVFITFRYIVLKIKSNGDREILASFSKEY